MGELRVGTCSWKYPSWKGLIYSRGEGIDYLKEYSARYDTVEVDQWFWSLFGVEAVRLPQPRDVRAYRASVGADFRFTVKAPNSVTLTHLYSKTGSRRGRLTVPGKESALKGSTAGASLERKGGSAVPLVANPHFLSVGLFERFLSALDPLKDVLGPVMFQFEYLNRKKMPSQGRFQESLSEFLKAIPESYQYAVETRNGNYLNESYFEFLEASGASPVLLQGYWMPPVVNVYREWESLINRHKTVVLRLQGPDREGIEKRGAGRWDKIIDPKDAELPDIAVMIKDLLSSGTDVYVNVNNHYEGSAPLTIDRLRSLL